LCADAGKRKFTLDLCGQSWEVSIDGEEICGVHLPFIKEVVKRSGTEEERFIIFLAGPPGSGKSTLASLWRVLALEEMSLDLLVLPLDGFHFSNSNLESKKIIREGSLVSLRSIKGAPETYDVARFGEKLRRLAEGEGLWWPLYDRALHEPLPDALEVRRSHRFCLIEGNYLLLDEPVWRDLSPFSSIKVFIETPEEICRKRTLARHIRGGKTPEEALQHYLRTDLANYRRIMEKRLEPDVIFRSSGERVDGPFWK